MATLLETAKDLVGKVEACSKTMPRAALRQLVQQGQAPARPDNTLPEPLWKKARAVSEATAKLAAVIDDFNDAIGKVE
jgi:hypothetical protein